MEGLPKKPKLVKDPWQEYNENVKRVIFILWCGKQLDKFNEPWKDLFKIIARYVFYPLEKNVCVDYSLNKECPLHDNFILGKYELFYGAFKFYNYFYQCNAKYQGFYHGICEFCYYPTNPDLEHIEDGLFLHCIRCDKR